MGLWWVVGEEDGGRGRVWWGSNVVDVAEKHGGGGGVWWGSSVIDATYHQKNR